MDTSQRYLRHLSLEGVGLAGQKKISESRVLIVGAGGLGVPASLYLASSGVGHLGICDGDIIEVSNLARQVLYGKNDVGQKKVQILSEKIFNLNSEIQLCPYDVYLTEKNANDICKNYDLILNASDNLNTRLIINKTAVELAIPWVDAAVLNFSGQVSYFLPNQGCYQCLFPSVTSENKNCNNEGILAPICGMFGSWSAVNVLKIILSMIQGNMFFEFDMKENRIKHFKWKKRDNCSVCSPMVFQSTNATSKKSLNLMVKTQEDKLSINRGLLSLLPSYILVDLGVYSTMGKEYSSLKNRISASLNDFFSQSLDDPIFIQQHGDKKQTYICVCEAGLKSKIAAEILVQEGFKAFWLE